jgi:MFS family permease
MSGVRPSEASGLRKALIGLCITETTSWGLLYYAFAVLLVPISEATGWSESRLSAAFSCGLVVSAIAGIWVGRLIDRYGPRLVMTLGSVLASVSLATVAMAPTYPVFFLAWTLAGVAMAAVLYQAGFAAITGWFDGGRVRALTTVTLAAGLASTIYAPITHALNEFLSWRGVFLVLAAFLAVVTVPLHAITLTPSWHGRAALRSGGMTSRGGWSVVRTRRFVGVASALTLGAIGSYGPNLIVIPLLTFRGMDSSLAVLTFGLLGAGQLLGRIGFAPLSARLTARTKMAVILGTLSLAVGLFAAVPGPAWLLVAIAILTGAARGAMTLLQATIVADYWGTRQYATIAGLVGTPVMIAIAVGPWAGTIVAARLGALPATFAVFALITGAAAAVSMTIGRGDGRPTRRNAAGSHPGGQQVHGDRAEPDPIT